MKNQYRCLLLFVAIAGCQRAEDQSVSSTAADNPSERTSAIPVAQAEPADLVDLRLRVQPGERFPLIKTVEQQVTQKSSSASANAVTRLQLSLILLVEEVTDDSVVFNVRYTRVHYAHNVDGRHSVYDSSAPTGSIPHDAVPYAGLVNNDYSMRIGRSNKVQELIGHDQFLQRCIAGVPHDRRQTLMNEVAVRFGDEGVAGFIPDTLGLLPFDTDATPELASRVQEGDSWNYERKLMQPIPVHLKSTCRVVRVTPATTEIDIAGRITPGQTYNSVKSSVGHSVRILGGITSGTCIVDRASGLPIDVNRQEILNVEVLSSKGTKISQEKRISTTVQLFPTERGPVVHTPIADSAIVPVSAAQPAADGGVHTIPTTAR
jgi:hypothetical protein